MNALASSIAVDEFGRPFIILREHKQERLQGLEALKVRESKQRFGSITHFCLFTAPYFGCQECC